MFSLIFQAVRQRVRARMMPAPFHPPSAYSGCANANGERDETQRLPVQARDRSHLWRPLVPSRKRAHTLTK